MFQIFGNLDLSILTLSNAFLSIDNRELKSESGFSFAIASQPLQMTVVPLDNAYINIV